MQMMAVVSRGDTRNLQMVRLLRGFQVKYGICEDLKKWGEKKYIKETTN